MKSIELSTEDRPSYAIGLTELPALASHGNPFAAVAGTPYIAEGEAAVIRPLGGQGFAIVARVRKDEWEKLAPSASSTAPKWLPFRAVSAG